MLMFLLSYQKDESVPIVEWMMLREGSYGVLCRFFEKMWEKNKTFTKKLRHCLTWPPMKSFLSCFCEFRNVYFVVYIYVYIYIYIYIYIDQIVKNHNVMEMYGYSQWHIGIQ